MPRRPPTPVDPVRRLAAVSLDGSGATGKLWNGEIYVRGMEEELPDDFPDDGPWWEDWIPEPKPLTRRGLAAHLAREEALALKEQNRVDGVDDGSVDEEDAGALEHADDLSHLPPAMRAALAAGAPAGLIPTDEAGAGSPALQQPLSGHPGSRRARTARGARARSEARDG